MKNALKFALGSVFAFALSSCGFFNFGSSSGLDEDETYTVIWENYDGTILQIDENVNYGDDVRYKGNQPTKESDGVHSYVFSGWNDGHTDQMMFTIYEDTTFTARYCETEYFTEGLVFGTGLTNNGNIVWQVNGYDGDSENVVIPHIYSTEYGDFTVEGIYSKALRENQNVERHVLKSVYIPNTVKYIDPWSVNAHLIFSESFSRPSGWQSGWNDCGQDSCIIWGYQNETGVTEDGFVYALSHVDDSYVYANIIGYEGDASELIIPSIVEHDNVDYPVQSLTNQAFENNLNITSVVIESDNLLEIDYRVFAGCSNLQNVVIDASRLEIIGDYSFAYCDSLTSVSIYSEDIFVKIGEKSFRNCYSLETLSLPECLYQIGDGAFFGCESLKELNLPNDLEYIGDSAFGNCSQLTYVFIPQYVSYLGSNAFSGCHGLEEIVISEHVNNLVIGSHAFFSCESLKLAFIPFGVIEIGEWCFTGNTWECPGSLFIYCERESEPAGFDEKWAWRAKHIMYGVSYDEYLFETGRSSTLD